MSAFQSGPFLRRATSATLTRPPESSPQNQVVPRQRPRRTKNLKSRKPFLLPRSLRMEAVAAGSLWRCRPAAPPLRRATTCPARPSPGHGLPPPGRLTEQAGFLAWWQVGNQSRQMLSRCRNLSREGGWLPRHTAGRAAFFSLRRLPVCLSRHLQDHLRPLSPWDARRAPK